MKPESPFRFAPFKARRDRLARMLKNGVVVLPTAAEVTRNSDVHYTFRWDSHFYYLTGFKEPEAVLVMLLGKKPRQILFCRERNAEREIWDGFRYGPAMAKVAFGFDETHPIEELEKRLPELIGNQHALHTPVGADAAWDMLIARALNTVRAKVRTGVTAPEELKDVRSALAAMRNIKDAHEIGVMRRAAAISSKAHARAMRFARPGLMEYQVEAELLHEFKVNGAHEAAYGSIVGGGANACILHYSSNDARLEDGDLLLIDAGCELEGYASDITRTFPVNGQFRGAQRDIYQLVLDAQLAAIKQVRPGRPYVAYHEAAVKVLAQGFIDLKLCKGSLDKVIETEDYRRFYMHRTGHWLGMDVHDVGNYMQDGKWVTFKPGHVVTVEPGCYIRPAKNVPRAFWNIGVRIEDDVLVTASGNDVLTKSCPKTIADVEAACNR